MDNQLIKNFTNNLPSKAEMQSIVSAYNERVNGENIPIDLNPIKEYVALKRVEQLAKDMQQIVKDQALADAANYSDKERKNLYGCKVTIKAGSVEYDYSNIPEWIEAYEEEQAYLEEAKMAANRRKAIEQNAIIAGIAKVVNKKDDNIAITIL